MQRFRLEIYQLDVSSGLFTPLAEVTTFKDGLTWIERYNKIGGCTFQIDIDDPVASTLNLTRFLNAVIVKEYTTATDFEVRWSGFITKISGDYRDVSGRISVECNTPLHALTARYTDYTDNFSAVDQSDILWTLISDTQARDNGKLGINEGSLTASVTRDRQYQRGQIAELITNMSRVIGGIDFTFSPLISAGNKFTGWNFNTYYPSVGSLREDLNVLSIGSNVQDLQFNTSEDIFNYVVGIGAGTGEQTLESIQENTGSQVGSTRREDFFSNKDVSIQETLDDQTESYLNSKASEKFEIAIELTPDVNPEYGTYSCGDYLKVEIQKGYLNINAWALVDEIKVVVDREGVPHVTPTLILI